MHYQLLIRFFPVLIITFGSGIALSAEDVDQTNDQNLQQEPIVVTATRFDTSIATAPVNTSIISAEQINKSSATNISQVLENLGGIHINNLIGESDSKSSVDMGGFGASGTSNTLILLNGRRLNDADLAGVNLAAIPLNAIERIEVIHGNASVLYGDNATSGVINIVTKTGFDSKATSLQIDTGTYSTQGAHFIHSGASNNFATSVALNVHNSDGYRDNSAIDSKNAITDFSYSSNAAIYGIRLNFSSENLELPGSLEESTYISNRTASNPTIEFSKENRSTTELYLQTDKFAAELGYRNRNQSSYLFGDITSNLHTLSFTPRYTVKVSQHTLVTGIDQYISSLKINSDFTGSFFPGFNKNDTVRNSLAAYLTDNIDIGGNAFLSLGIRRQRVGIKIDNNNILSAVKTKEKQTDSLNAWDITVGKKFGPSYKAYLRYAYGMRFPLLDEIWEFTTGNINLLKPQTSKHLEAGIHMHLPHSNDIDLSVFHIKLKNEIGYDAIAFANLNFDATEHNGFDINYHAFLNPNWQLGSNINWRRATFDDGPYDGNEIPEIPKLRASLSQSYQFNNHQRLAIDIAYTGERGFGSDFLNNGKKMGGYTMVNAKFQKDVAEWAFALNIYNLTNKKTADAGQYYEFGSIQYYYYYPLPERTLLLTASAKL